MDPEILQLAIPGDQRASGQVCPALDEVDSLTQGGIWDSGVVAEPLGQ